MIIQGLLIVLVVLIVANFAVGFFNQVSPPCMDASEYFQGAKQLPDGAVAGLGSIPTHTWQDYVGAMRVDTGIPGVIGLQSYNQKNNQKNGYIGDTSDSMESYINPVVSAFNNDDPSDCAEHISTEATDAIDNILQPGKKGRAQSLACDKPGSLSEFEVNMECVTSKNSETLKGRHMSLAHNTARDGYTSRPGDKTT